jgi:Nif-specific regulatory protein
MAIANLGKENLFLDRTGARRHLDRSQLAFLCVPIVYNGKVAGVLSADKLTHKVTDLEEEVAILSAVADLIAKAVYGLGLEEENRSLRKMLSRTRTISTDIIGNSKPMLDVLNMISQVADSGTTVLINGETGTGKELVARAIHANSPRKDGPFVQVNCAAMPDTLVESELFGHEKGAFTGAIQRRRGLFEEAHGGTIFLDEIGELSQAAQAKVLRVLQERQLQPVGSSRTVTVNVRIIAATNRNLEQDVAEGRFRADLFYRLNVVSLFLPPLRERREDVPLLLSYFLKLKAQEHSIAPKSLSPEVVDFFTSYYWPGNIRELENLIERLTILTASELITLRDLPVGMRSSDPTATLKEDVLSGSRPLSEAVDEFERELIVKALQRTGFNQTKAALLLGTSRRILKYRIEKLKINEGNDSSEEVKLDT